MIRTFPGPRSATGWIKAAGAVLAALVLMSVVAHQWDRLWSWLPWSDARRLERVIDQRDRLAAEADAMRAHIELLTRQARRVETVHRQVIDLRDLTDPVLLEARSAPDASIPLDSARADRLREHDRRLCDLAPGACADEAAAPSGVRVEALPDRDPG
ncbi:MAG: hypothetical protein ACK4FB_02810 [Brevundimonas sp.]|uniref:hypothetical protein n=1 Tax=Brevundimonas sp. TaxID=1871086 RepID=UPI003919C88A